MSSGYEEQELTAIDAALDANPDATSNEVFQATRPFDERAIASVAASRALAGGGGGSSSVGVAGHGYFNQGSGGALIDGVREFVTWSAVRDSAGWLNGSTYDSPDWEGESYLANQTFVLPVGLYLIAYAVNASDAGSVTSFDGDFACVDNRLASTLSDFLYADGPSPIEDSQPNWAAGFSLAVLQAEHLIVVPTDATPGLVFGLAIRPHGGGASGYTAALSIQKICDWSAAST